MEDSDDDAYDEKIENNRYHIVKVLNPEATFDILRQERILTEEDVERIRKKTTRRNRAGALLDILRTKGNNGVNKFVDCLEYENPECFEKITRKKPRPPPKGYAQSRQSVLLTILNELPRIVLDIKRDVKEKKDLTKTLEDSEQILQLAQKEKQDLEEENEKLKKELHLLEMQMKTSKSEADKTIHKLKCDNAAHQRDRHLLKTEKDRFKENLMTFQKMKDDVEKENQNLREKMSRERDAAETTRRSILVQTRSLDKKESEMITQHILREQRDEARENAEFLAEDLSRLRQELEETQNAYSREHQNVQILSMKISELTTMLEVKQKRNDEYYERIQEQYKEKEVLEDEKRAEQKKYEEQAKRANNIFSEKHQIENRYDELKFKYDNLKAEYRYCQEKLNSESTSKKGSSCSSKSSSTSYEKPWTGEGVNTGASCSSPQIRPQMMGSIDSGISSPFEEVRDHHTKTALCKEQAVDLPEQAPLVTFRSKSSGSVDEDSSLRPRAIADQESDSSFSSTDLQDFVKYDVHGEFLPPKIERIHRESNRFTIVLKTPILGEKITIIGGNITGIFVQDVLQENGNLHLLNVGDEITGVHIFSSSRHVNGENIRLQGMTLEQVKNLLSPTEEVDIELCITHDKPRYGVIKQWLSHNESNGDYFYVRCQFNWSVPKSVPDSIPVKLGDVFRVTNTNNIGHEGFWRVVKFTGVRCYGLIPNMAGARTYQRKHLKNGDDKGICHHDAFKFKLPYQRVLPVKALNKMPVFVFGSDDLVDAVLNLLMKESTSYILDDTGNYGNSISSRNKDAKSRNKHLLLKGGKGTKSANLKFINIFITAEGECQDVLKKLFDRCITVDDQELLSKMKSKFEVTGAAYDIITINGKQCHDKDSLLKLIQNRVSNSQNRYMWLSEKELSPMILDKYKAYMQSPEIPLLTETD